LVCEKKNCPRVTGVRPSNLVFEVVSGVMGKKKSGKRSSSASASSSSSSLSKPSAAASASAPPADLGAGSVHSLGVSADALSSSSSLNQHQNSAKEISSSHHGEDDAVTISEVTLSAGDDSAVQHNDNARDSGAPHVDDEPVTPTPPSVTTRPSGEPSLAPSLGAYAGNARVGLKILGEGTPGLRPESSVAVTGTTSSSEDMAALDVSADTEDDAQSRAVVNSQQQRDEVVSTPQSQAAAPLPAEEEATVERKASSSQVSNVTSPDGLNDEVTRLRAELEGTAGVWERLQDALERSETLEAELASVRAELDVVRSGGEGRAAAQQARQAVGAEYELRLSRAEAALERERANAASRRSEGEALKAALAAAVRERDSAKASASSASDALVERERNIAEELRTQLAALEQDRVLGSADMDGAKAELTRLRKVNAELEEELLQRTRSLWTAQAAVKSAEDAAESAKSERDAFELAAASAAKATEKLLFENENLAEQFNLRGMRLAALEAQLGISGSELTAAVDVDASAGEPVNADDVVADDNAGTAESDEAAGDNATDAKAQVDPAPDAAAAGVLPSDPPSAPAHNKPRNRVGFFGYILGRDLLSGEA